MRRARRSVGLLAAVCCVMVTVGCLRDTVRKCGSGWAVVEDADAAGMSLFDGKTLGRWRVTDFLGAGRVYVEDESIILEKGEELTGITWGGSVIPIDYEINLEAMRVEGEDFFCGLTFPVGKDHCTLIVGGWRGKVVGLSNIDLMDAAENGTTVLMDFETGRWYAIRLRVTPERILAWIDSDKLIDVEITNRIIDVRYEVESSRPLGIATWKTMGAIRNISLRPLKQPVSVE